MHICIHTEYTIPAPQPTGGGGASFTPIIHTHTCIHIHTIPPQQPTGGAHFSLCNSPSIHIILQTITITGV